jgi:hypothetical protein
VTRALALGLAACGLTAAPLAGQTVRGGVHGVAVTHNEINERLGARGLGVGGLLALRVGRFGLEARAFWADLEPREGQNVAFHVIQADVRGSLLVARAIAFEVGAGRRWIDPEFATQEVGVVRVGILSQYPLSRLASVWARGAYLVVPQFSGGGDAGLSVELSLGTAIGTANGRFRAMGEYEFQRLDREVRGRGVPIQVTVARFGVEVGL